MEAQLTYSSWQWELVLASFVVAMFALFASFIYLIVSRSELSSKYRPAGNAGAIVALIATIAYGVLIVAWVVGFDYDSVTRTYSASDSALQFHNGFRYVDWIVTVPLLTAELIGVSLLTGERAKNVRFIWFSLAILMIATGFLGEDILGRIAAPDQDVFQFFLWGILSTIAFIPLYAWILRETLRAPREQGHPVGTHIRNAGFVLAFTWGVYPLAYLVPFFFPESAGWGVGRQLAFTAADIAAKVGYGFLIHAAAKARTAADVAGGDSPHPEAVYINNDKMAEAQPVLPGARIPVSYGHPLTSKPLHDGAPAAAVPGGLSEARGES